MLNPPRRRDDVHDAVRPEEQYDGRHEQVVDREVPVAENVLRHLETHGERVEDAV